MGLASSQARMLLLTARKSDLEFRAQMISQRKMNLAMQTQELATNYSTAMSNRKLQFAWTTDSNNNSVVYEDLSYLGLTSTNSQNIGDYLVTTASGKYVYDPSITYEDGLQVDDTTKPIYEKDPESPVIKYEQYQVNDDGTYKLENGQKIAIAEGDTPVQEFRRKADGTYEKDPNGKNIPVYETDADGNIQYETKLVGYEQKTVTSDMDRIAAKILNGYGYALTEANMKMAYTQMVDCDALDNTSFFQNALRDGSLFVNQLQQGGGYEQVSATSISTVTDRLDTTDDAAAQADYETKSLILSNQDKMLDLELNQIETQHKAIETEYDSVKKVIDKNIEVSYKIFA